MMKGFFAESDLKSRVPLSLIPQCGKCKLYQNCDSPKMKVVGEGQRKILVIGESPGKTEDQQGKPFVGKAGRKLREVLRKIGVDLNRDCWITNSAICRPVNNVLPEKAVDYCRPNVINAIQELQPETIILLGKSAVQSVIGWLWKENVGEMGRWIGWQIPNQRLNAWLCPIWHPSFVMRMNDPRPNEVVNMMFENHLRSVFELRGRPWQEVPNYDKQCKTIIDVNEAVKRIDVMRENGKPIAFDFETTMLKPDSERARIVCCSICDGGTSIAYPWQGEVIRATKEILESDIPKLGWSIKFEDRWSRRNGIRVRNWKWDGMIAAHILDCRPGISGLKFSAFVNLGVEAYSNQIEPYLKSVMDGGNSENRIREVGLNTVLKYCATDSLLEYLLCKKQMRRVGMEL